MGILAGRLADGRLRAFGGFFLVVLSSQWNRKQDHQLRVNTRKEQEV